MKIAVSAFGTEGDVRPAAALAGGLRRRGHEVSLIASPMYSHLAQQAGVPLRPAIPQVSLDQFLERKRQLLVEALSQTSPYRQTDLFFSLHSQELLDSLEHVREATRDADVIVHSFLDVAAYVASLLHRKPHVPLLYFQGFLPTHGEAYSGRKGTLLTRLLSRLEPWLLAQITNGHFNRLLDAAGLPRQRSTLLRATRSPWLTLLSVSPSLFPTDPLWKDMRVAQTGFWFLDSPHFEPSAELAAFMSGPDKPLVINFGSMVSPDPKRLTHMLCEAVGRVGCRAVLQAGWNGLGEGPLPANMLRVGHVPHDWLLPRAAGLLHHGGAGTTGAALRAGVPQATAWFLGDQSAWGELLFNRGLSPSRPVHHLKITVEWLERAMRQLLQDTAQRERAAALGERVRAEDGIGQAVEALEQAFSSGQGPRGVQAAA
jgi:sterol 3beta-glucosyltransferase